LPNRSDDFERAQFSGALTAIIKRPHYDHGCGLRVPDLVTFVIMMAEWSENFKPTLDFPKLDRRKK
jgi:hypothetical protein